MYDCRHAVSVRLVQSRENENAVPLEESPVVATPPTTPAPVAPTTPKTASIVDEYEIESSASSEAPVVSESAPAPPPTKPRDPETGQFMKAEHPKGLVRRAAELGMSEQEISEASTTQLDSLVYHLNQQSLAEARTASQAAVLDRVRSDRDTSGAAATQQDAGAGSGEVGGGAPEFDLGINEDDFHPDLVRVLKKMHGEQMAKIKALEAQVLGLAQRDNLRTQETTNEKIDRVFEQLGDDANFGKGPVSDLTAEDPAYARRIAVLNEARRMSGAKAGLAAQLANIKKAAERLYGSRAPAPPPRTAPPSPASSPTATASAANGNRITPEEWQAAGLARPTNRETDEPPSTKKAERAVASYMKENGMNDRPGMDSFLD